MRKPLLQPFIIKNSDNRIGSPLYIMRLDTNITFVFF